MPHTPFNQKNNFFQVKRLLGLIQSGSEKPLILLVAPPGYGKTTLIQQVLDQCDWKIIRINLKEEHNYPKNFFSEFYLKTQANHTNINSTHKTIEASFNDLMDPTKNDHQKTFIIFDNYHLIDSPEIHETLFTQIVDSPDNFHFLISSQTIPPFPLSKMRLENKIQELTIQHLSLTYQETKEFLKTHVKKTLPENLLNFIWKKTEGWIVMLLFLVNHINEYANPNQIQKEIESYIPSIYNYLDEEIFNKIPKNQQNFLLASGITNFFPKQLAETVFGELEPHQILRILERKQLIRRYGNEYVYHPQLSAYLKQKSLEIIPNQISNLHFKIAEWNLNHHFPQKAFHHFLESGANEQAIQVINAVGWDLLRHGKHDLIFSWCEKIITLAGKHQHDLSEILVFTLLQKGKLNEAHKLLDGLQTAKGLLASAMIARYQGKYDDVEKVYQDALKTIPEFDNVLRCQLELQIGLARLYHRKVIEAEQVLCKALLRAEQSGDSNLIRLTTTALSVVYHNRGIYNSSILMLTRALSIGEDEPSEDSYSTKIRLAQLELEIGNIKNASKRINETIHFGKKILSPESNAYGHLVAARIERIKGDYTKAAELHQTATRLAPTGGFMKQANLTERMLLYLSTNEFAVVESWVNENGLNPEIAEYTGDECYIVLARLYIKLGQPVLAIQTLKNIIQQAQANNWTGAVMHSLPWLAIASFLDGDQETAYSLINQSIQLSSPQEYCYAYLEIYQNYPDILTKLFNRNKSLPYVNDLFRKIKQLPLHSSKTQNALTASPIISQEQYEIRAFGGLRVFRNGMEIAENGWRTERARDLLAFLATQYHSPLPIEIILETLWPNRPLIDTRKLFHTNLYFLKRTLLSKNENLNIILYSSGRYQLNHQYFWVDVQEYDQLINQQTNPKALQKALELANQSCLYGFYDDWAIELQNQYEIKQINTLKTLSLYYAQENELANAIFYAQKALQKDPFREDLAQYVIQWNIQLGDYASALTCYKRIKQKLAEEFSISPSQETFSLIEKIQTP